MGWYDPDFNYHEGDPGGSNGANAFITALIVLGLIVLLILLIW